MNSGKIIKYFFRDIMRNKWVVFYSAILFIASVAILFFSRDTQKGFVSILNIVLYLIPLMCMMFSSVYYYNSREFIEMLLSQPVNRTAVFYGEYISLSLSQSLGFIAGVVIPLSVYDFGFNSLSILVSGTFLIFIFTGISLLLSVLINDRVRGIGVLIAAWLFLAVFYDGLILFIYYNFSDYPLEKVTIAASSLNPVDITRTMIMLKLDISALFGYTGATFKKYFGSYAGYIVSVFMLHLWILIPAAIAKRKFRKKNF